jgi:hypothetical protein
MFLFAYRAFIEALGTGDKDTLKKMTEPSLYKRLLGNVETIGMDKFDSSYFKVADKIKLKMKLLDLQIINGVYIDRTRNLNPNFYEITADASKIIYSIRDMESASSTKVADAFKLLKAEKSAKGKAWTDEDSKASKSK